jgi:NADPH-dependent 2,4-dienoyl-CoA reductase/sulfur reductase-like enzyme
MPKGVRWVQRAAVAVDPDAHEITLVDYEFLVMCPGIQLDWDKITGLEQALGRNGVSSNYSYLDRLVVLAGAAALGLTKQIEVGRPQVAAL